MVGEKNLEDRNFFEYLRKKQRELVLKELEKEKKEVERRVIEEEKKREIEEERLQLEKTKRRSIKLFIFTLILCSLILLIYFLTKKNF